ncbi:hypothetical protein FFF34_017615 [Inquilinus sp. KBS0705]|nr:hypothetical protein FFF34_017615 [Inquilinus sp. KBS0705]
MKTIKATHLLIFSILVLFTACKKDSVDHAGTKYTNNKGIEVYITKNEWYLTRNSMGGGFVNLRFAGSTNADKISIRTVGDGLLMDNNLPLTNAKFSGDGPISFTATSVPSGTFKAQTILTAQKGDQVFEVTLVSEDLKY